MSYYIAKTVSGAFDSVVADITAQLKAQGFGILSDIDVQATLIQCRLSRREIRAHASHPHINAAGNGWPLRRTTTPPQ